MTRVYNFSAGPAALPVEVLQQARDEMLDYRGSGMSVMETSHRGREFSEIAETAESDLRELLGITEDYTVLFLQGGATLQFAAAPLNLAGPEARADYVVTGSWGKKAIAEAGKHCEAHVAASSADTAFDRVPERAGWDTDPGAAFLHYTSNETIGGVEFHDVPESGDVPLVVDMSSNILSRPIDVSRFGLIYAGAQKNIGPAGLTIVILRRDLLARCRDSLPNMLNYSVHAAAGSMSNTPPTYAWYIAGLTFAWLKRQGGLAAMAEVNDRKAAHLYGAVDASGFYSNPVEPASRSRMNVPFVLANPELDATFLSEAADEGLVTLKGHRSVGGMRASIYNAMPYEGVAALVQFMSEFERRRG
ncbi:MAG: 3-phosphoserine/phosphohydroxythreonine transaminase [Pseudomonadota bacterium]